MPFNVAVILAFGILITSLMVMVAIAARRRQAAKEDEMRHTLATRGYGRMDEFTTIVIGGAGASIATFMRKAPSRATS